MNCQKVDNLLSAYLDREVSRTESRDIRLHLEECPRCRAEYLRLSQSKELLAAFHEVEPPSDLHASLIANLGSTEASPFYQWLDRFKPLALAGALGLVLFAVIGLPLAQGERMAKVDPLSDLSFLLSEHQRFQLNKPFANAFPPINPQKQGATSFILPASLRGEMAPTVVTATYAPQEVLLSHHIKRH